MYVPSIDSHIFGKSRSIPIIIESLVSIPNEMLMY